MTMKTMRWGIMLMMMWAGSAPAFAADTGSAVGAAATDEYTEGEVRRIDADASKITIRHGPIKSLGMGAMTMVFQVRDRALLDRAKVGEKIRFTAISDNGATIVTDIQPVK